MLMQSARSAPSAAAASRSTGVPGLHATPAPSPSSRAAAITAPASSATSTWKVTLSPPDSAISRKWCTGSSTIRWQSSTPPRSCTGRAIERRTTGPIVTGGTKWPSPTSKWKTRAPASRSRSSCSPRRRKSAAYSDGSISAPRTHSLQPTRPILGSPQPAGRLDVPRGDARLVLGEAPRDGVRDPPPAHALAVEAELGREDVEAPLDAAETVAEQRDRHDLALGDDRLRVDREPRLPLGGEDVAAVEVLAADDELSLCRRQVAQRRDGGVEEPALERPAGLLPATRQLFAPARGGDGEGRERVFGGRGPG